MTVNRLPLDDAYLLTLVKGKERWVFRYEDTQRADVIWKFGDFAKNQDLSFNWYDVAVLSMKVREGDTAAEDHG